MWVNGEEGEWRLQMFIEQLPVCQLLFGGRIVMNETDELVSFLVWEIDNKHVNQ